MDYTTRINQQISELADGELAENKTDETMRILRDPAQLDRWTLYHQIGDVLRSEQMSVPVSVDFSARLAARLEAEPIVLRPEARLKKRLCGWPGAFAAIAATGLFVVLAPSVISQWMPGHLDDSVAPSANLATAPLTVARDGQFDPYILVHQSSYSSLYGSAQLGRPAPVAAESE